MHQSGLAALCFLATSCAHMSSMSTDPSSSSMPSHGRSVVYARNGMVAASHPLAVEIGLDVLKAGGSAVDAAIAVNAALGFLEPTMCGIGGDLFALVWDAKEQKLHGLNASGPAPAGLSIEDIEPEEDGTIPLRSPATWTVPGCVDGWFTLHARFGRLPMADVLAPAIRSAREGAPVPRVIAEMWAAEGAALRGRPGFDATYFPGGRAPSEGEVFRNPALADTYELLADDGRDAFYAGPIADAIEAFARQHGGYLTRADLEAFHSQWQEPVSTTYRGVELFELPPNGQGLAALQMLNILENFDLRGMGRESPDYWHVMVEAKKLAFEHRAHFYADPDFFEAPIDELLSKEYGARLAHHIDMDHATDQVDVATEPLEKGDTTYLCVADSEGNMVSLIQSVFWEFGSGYVLDGFALQNRGSLFNLDPNHPNALAPGKRPFHTIIPAFAMRDGVPWLAFGVMGGSMQPQGHAQVLINMIDFDMDLQAAGDAARFRHRGSSQPTGTVMRDGGVLSLEAAVPESIRRALEAKGHRVEIGPGSAFGGYQAIARDPESAVYAGASEPRKDGLAAGY